MFKYWKDILQKKELDEDKKDFELEKNDLLALFIAAASVILPALLIVFAFFALVIWIFL